MSESLSSALARVARSATPAPWVTRFGRDIHSDGLAFYANKDGSMSKRHSGTGMPVFYDSTGRKKRMREDIAYICAMRSATPQLIAALRFAEVMSAELGDAAFAALYPEAQAALAQYREACKDAPPFVDEIAELDERRSRHDAEMDARIKRRMRHDEGEDDSGEEWKGVSDGRS